MNGGIAGVPTAPSRGNRTDVNGTSFQRSAIRFGQIIQDNINAAKDAAFLNVERRIHRGEISRAAAVDTSYESAESSLAIGTEITREFHGDSQHRSWLQEVRGQLGQPNTRIHGHASVRDARQLGGYSEHRTRNNRLEVDEGGGGGGGEGGGHLHPRKAVVSDAKERAREGYSPSSPASSRRLFSNPPHRSCQFTGSRCFSKHEAKPLPVDGEGHAPFPLPARSNGRPQRPHSYPKRNGARTRKSQAPHPLWTARTRCLLIFDGRCYRAKREYRQPRGLRVH